MEYFDLGYINKIVGNRGEVSLTMDTDYPEDYSGLSSIYLDIKGTIIPYTIEKIKLHSNKATLKLSLIDSTEVASLLIGATAHLPLELLPKLKGNQFYFHEVIGYEVSDKKHGLIGKVDGVIDQTNQAILQIVEAKREILIPISDDIIKKVDRKNKRIDIIAPEGLIEIYLEE